MDYDHLIKDFEDQNKLLDKIIKNVVAKIMKVKILYFGENMIME